MGAAFGKRGLGHICVVSRHPTLVPGLSSVNSGSEYRFPKIRGLSHTPILYPGSSIEKMNATKIQGLSFLGLTLSILGCLGPHQICIEPRRANYVSEQPATPRRVPDCSTPISIPRHVHRITWKQDGPPRNIRMPLGALWSPPRDLGATFAPRNTRTSGWQQEGHPETWQGLLKACWQVCWRSLWNKLKYKAVSWILSSRASCGKVPPLPKNMFFQAILVIR